MKIFSHPVDCCFVLIAVPLSGLGLIPGARVGLLEDIPYDGMTCSTLMQGVGGEEEYWSYPNNVADFVDSHGNPYSLGVMGGGSAGWKHRG